MEPNYIDILDQHRFYSINKKSKAKINHIPYRTKNRWTKFSTDKNFSGHNFRHQLKILALLSVL